MAATMEDLIPFIYHERQQPGSMLCAQHALNSLLQGPYFTAPDLSEIAQRLDAMEQGYDEDNRGESTNMDDTGFFSVQVLEEALQQVWGLTLVRWRSEAMRSFQDHPNTQLAFVLNQHEHWYTLRRFGPALPNAADDPGDGHWFNLNSSLERPEWVGKLYLGMFLQEAEAQGYSVFAVVQRDPSGDLALPRSQADEVATAVAEPTARDRRRPVHAGVSSTRATVEGFEDEDMELQAALQASLMGSGGAYEASGAGVDRSYPAPVTAASADPIFGAGSGRATPVQRRGYGMLVQDEDDEDDAGDVAGRSASVPVPMDPLAASRARNEAFMEMMRRQQEAALRETFDAEAVGRQRHTRAQQEEEELLRAIEESRRIHEAQGDAPAPDDDEEHPPPPQPPSTLGRDRVYDDEDAELQAALRASLETVPEGFCLPSTPPRAPPPSLPARHTAPPPQAGEEVSAPDDEFETESEAETSSVAEPEPQLSMEEIRRRRLAKFGG